MTEDALFKLAGNVALLGWLILLLQGWKRWASGVVAGLLLPLLLAALYAFLIAAHIGGSTGNFNSLAGVSALFSNRWLLLAGWVHYLAFDLFVGSWEARDAARNGISHWLVILCLPPTFLFGPVGFLLYVAVRTVKTRQTL